VNALRREKDAALLDKTRRDRAVNLSAPQTDLSVTEPGGARRVHVR
jgi:hypothetical protein